MDAYFQHRLSIVCFIEANKARVLAGLPVKSASSGKLASLVVTKLTMPSFTCQYLAYQPL